MEILSLVWAASIIHPSTPMAFAAGTEAHKLQHQAPIAFKGMASQLPSLAQAYNWTAIASELISEPTTVFSSYASIASWVTPDLSSPVEQRSTSFEFSDSLDSQFVPLSPVISTSLTDLIPPIDISANVPNFEDANAANQWHSWDTVASVRIVESNQQPTLEGSASASKEPASSSPPDADCLPDLPATYQASPIAMTASPKLQVWVHNQFIGEVTGRAAAQQLATKLRSLIQQKKIEPSHLKPIVGSNFVGGSLRSDILFVVDETMRSHPDVPAAAIAIQWINNLRLAFDESPLNPVQIQMAMVGLTETSQALYGIASWYGPGFHGRKTANGERFDENTLTAAHKTLPFNTHLKVTNRLNGRSVVVRINDRGPYIGNRTLDLSKAAADCLGSIGRGIVPYEAVVLAPLPKPDLDQLTTAKLELD